MSPKLANQCRDPDEPPSICCLNVKMGHRTNKSASRSLLASRVRRFFVYLGAKGRNPAGPFEVDPWHGRDRSMAPFTRLAGSLLSSLRSEERRVGKECRSRW